MAAGIEPWRLILDPGLGFAKAGDSSMALMGGLQRVRRLLSPPLRNLPMLLGPSRKGFLGKLTGECSGRDRHTQWLRAKQAAH
jgi:2-amino-4-hydroxy-6-hydroxymethyldihydropteridine diphosphokinase/dihydropteroate synthase